MVSQGLCWQAPTLGGGKWDRVVIFCHSLRRTCTWAHHSFSLP